MCMLPPVTPERSLHASGLAEPGHACLDVPSPVRVGIGLAGAPSKQASRGGRQGRDIVLSGQSALVLVTW